MKILILGAGQVGSTLAKYLCLDDDNDITIVDQKEEMLIPLQRHLDIKTVIGYGAYPSVLEKAGIKSMDLVIAVMNSDERNMVACRMAHTLYHVEKKIARIRTTEYLLRPEIFSNDALPIDFLITPENLITEYIQGIVEEPGASQVFDFENGLVQLVETRAYIGTPIVNRPIKELQEHMPDVKIRIVSLYRNERAIPAKSDTVIREGDHVYFIAKKSESEENLNSEELRMAVKDSKSMMTSSYQRMLLNIIDLEKVKVEDIMIPHNELVIADIDDEDELFDHFKRIQHNRLLIYKGSENNIIGTIHMRDVVNSYAKDEADIKEIKELIREPYFIPEGTLLSQQLEHFKNQKRRLGVVVDEYGEVQGMVVLDDILEEIVGQFTSSQSESIDEIYLQKDGSYLVDPRISIREINSELKIKLPFDNAKTLNGLILEHLQSFPQHNVSLKIDPLIIEIIQVSKQGIKLVKITKL
ncbi:NAD-binding protein [Candidatus Thioglobus sp.]|nr:NAD-binding protein [Candidatus Thioglobus sp.]